MGVNKAWHFHFPWKKYTTHFDWLLMNLTFYNEQRFYGGRRALLFDKNIHEY